MRSRSLIRAGIGLGLVVALAGCDAVVAPPPDGCAAVGIDISRHQGAIDWGKVAGAGVRFAWIKATEGGDYVDPAFRRNWLLADAHGVKRGAYHFVYWCRPALEQAAWFIANVPADPDALPPVLDVEWNPQSRSCPGRVEHEKGIAEIRIMLEAMTRAYGRKPLIYAPADIYRDVLDGSFDDYPYWVRGVRGGPAPTYAGPWNVWQYSETGIVPGVKGDVDLDCIPQRKS